VLAVSLVLLFPRIRKAGLGGSAVALALIFAETAASALWLYPEFTLNHGTVHRSLLPVSAAASVWLAALLASACYPAPVPAEAPRSRASRRSSKPG
jgi:O-antigen/teichoic acid export membrane protein